jgi:hypothetical protein
VTRFVARDEHQGFSGNTMNLNLNLSLELWRVGRKRLAQTPVQFWIVRLPQFVSDVDAGEIDVAAAEAQFNCVFVR